MSRSWWRGPPESALVRDPATTGATRLKTSRRNLSQDLNGFPSLISGGISWCFQWPKESFSESKSDITRNQQKYMFRGWEFTLIAPLSRSFLKQWLSSAVSTAAMLLLLVTSVHTYTHTNTYTYPWVNSWALWPVKSGFNRTRDVGFKCWTALKRKDAGTLGL